MNHRDESHHKEKHQRKASYESQHRMFYMVYDSLFHSSFQGLAELKMNIDKSHTNIHIYRAEGVDRLIVLFKRVAKHLEIVA